MSKFDQVYLTGLSYQIGMTKGGSEAQCTTQRGLAMQVDRTNGQLAAAAGTIRLERSSCETL